MLRVKKKAFGEAFVDTPYISFKFFRKFEQHQWTKALEAVETLILEKSILRDDDILLMSHLDELLSRRSVYMAKHCQLRRSVMYGAIIMPMGNLNHAFR